MQGKCLCQVVEQTKRIRMIQTALREAEEEIVLDPALVDVVTILDPFVTKKNVTVVLVMGILWDKHSFNPVPNAGEVESIFYAPLEMFLKNQPANSMYWTGRVLLVVHTECWCLKCMMPAFTVHVGNQEKESLLICSAAETMEPHDDCINC
ncbi:hypothetical protein L2E82_17699 [Cichorium intybus]|uniref:Uncharacterized protein n=1 Tax=Cichorium intybus TaxID=13427 RepID=A0ACB9F9R1_CICIN|nr:hypothetical protein L2E82_17699 [Cichorium intybus]